MSARRQIIQAVTSGTMTQAQAAKAYGVSRSWVSKLLRQWAREGDDAFYPGSRRPRSHPAQTPPAMVTAIKDLRTRLSSQGLDAGPATIRDHLRKNLPQDQVPSRATIARTLTRENLVAPAPKKRPKSSLVRFEADLPNGCWQSDVTHVALADDSVVEVITWLDDHSRYALHISAHERVTVGTVVESFTAAALMFGYPAATLTDNGLVYTARFRGGVNRFEKLLRRHDVAQRNGQGHHPQTQGKVERFQQTMKNWLKARPAPKTLTRLNTLLEDFAHLYNTQRIHSAKATTPYAAYIGRPKDGPTPLGPEETRYRHDRIDINGTVTLRYESRMYHIGVGRTHARTRVVLLVKDRHIMVVDYRTGEILRDLVLDPSRKYQPQSKTPRT